MEFSSIEKCESPLVSVVIPTRGRPELLYRAIDSVLKQTMPDLEVIVVVDGQDDVSEDTLKSFEDPRIRWLVQPHQKGAPAARNRGFSVARGEWISLLDDDDEWLPEKLARQLDSAKASELRYPIVASSLIARTPLKDYYWPRNVPTMNVPISEYIMARNSWFAGDRLIQTSTVFAPTELFRKVPYAESLPKHQDWDWLLKALQVDGAGLLFLEKPLAIWYIEERRSSISSSSNWRMSENWIESVSDLVTPRAFSSFMLLYVGSMAARAHAYREIFRIWRKAIVKGKAPFKTQVLYFGYWVIPSALRQKIRSYLSG